jgi:hypothetical protein
VRQFAIALSFACVAGSAFGQGGPPMITDDPVNLEAGKWEKQFRDYPRTSPE